MIMAIVGPTASGKSDFALDVASRLGGPDHVELISADAMQLYRGMDIGTAKLTAEEMREFRHHQLDILEIGDKASVAAYQKNARADVEDIAQRGKTPIVVGGSGLYVRALLDRIEFPGVDARVRSRLERELEQVGSTGLHTYLAKLDPIAASRIDRANGRRIVRALEVIEITGRPFSASLPSYEYEYPTVQVGLRLESADLERRIALRVDKMFKDGLVEEVRSLSQIGLADTPTASRATGYSQVLSMLVGAITEERAREDIVRATTQLARRQIKWFRRDPRITWVNPLEDRDGALSTATDLFLAESMRDAEDSEAFLGCDPVD